MENEVGLIKSEVAEKMLKGGFPSPIGNEVGLMAPFWRPVFSRALEPICG